MFDSNSHNKDYFDNHVVISRAGGGMAKDKDSGSMQYNGDQSNDTAAVKALKNCKQHFKPVVIMVRASNSHIVTKPPHQYCVLDHFEATHIWVEKSGKAKILRYRFEKLNSKKESWWRPVSLFSMHCSSMVQDIIIAHLSDSFEHYMNYESPLEYHVLTFSRRISNYLTSIPWIRL